MKDVLQKIKEAFEKSGLSYVQLAERTGISKSALQRYLTGSTEKFPMDRLEKICAALDLDAAEIMGWSRSNEDEALDSQLISMLTDLTPDEFQRVADFIAGMKAARKK